MNIKGKKYLSLTGSKFINPNKLKIYHFLLFGIYGSTFCRPFIFLPALFSTLHKNRWLGIDCPVTFAILCMLVAQTQPSVVLFQKNFKLSLVSYLTKNVVCLRERNVFFKSQAKKISWAKLGSAYARFNYFETKTCLIFRTSLTWMTCMISMNVSMLYFTAYTYI